MKRKLTGNGSCNSSDAHTKDNGKRLISKRGKMFGALEVLLLWQDVPVFGIITYYYQLSSYPKMLSHWIS